MTTWIPPLASATAPLSPYDAGPFQCAAAWNVSAGGLYLAGYAWSVPAGGDTGAQDFRCWQICDTSHDLVSAEVLPAAVTSGPLAEAAVNNVMLAAPVPLGQGVPYATGTQWVPVNGFPITENQFGDGEPLGGGLVTGPVNVYTGRTGALPVPFTSDLPQGLFGTSSSTPPPMPTTGDSDSNFGIAPIITNVPPAGASYIPWPSQPAPVNWHLDTADQFTLGTQFGLATRCRVLAIGYFSPPDAGSLATEAGIWDIATEQVIAGTHQPAPVWSGIAGSGFVESPYAVPPVLGVYDLFKASVFGGDNVSPWSAAIQDYWSTGPGGGGLVNGPLRVPGLSAAAEPGQSTYHLGPQFAYPDTFNGPSAGANYLVYARVQPLTAATPGGWALDPVTALIMRIGRH